MRLLLLVNHGFKCHHEIGNVVSADKDSLKILRDSDNHYIIPKSRVLTFTGENMRVDFRFNDLLLVELASLSYIEP